MSEMIDPNAEIERISGRIKALVEEHFGRGEAQFYLSGLGSLLGEDRLALERLSKRKLGDFVANVLDYELGKSGQHLNVLHIVRPETFGPATITPERKSTKFIPEIWTSFAKPLSEGERRFFDPAALAVSSEPDGAGAAREISAAYLSREPRPAGQVGDSIRKWIDDQSLDLSLFVATRARRDSGGATLLDQLLDALDGEQLRRAQLPLDVIKTLSERRGA